MKRKGWALLLALMMMWTIVPVGAEDFEIIVTEEAAEPALRIPEGAEVLERLTVGNPTPMRGDFWTDMWGNATTDIDVRELLHGYDLVIWSGDEGMFMHNPSVVSEITAIRDEAGNHQYLLSLYNDLYYSDGTPITAWDYAFSWLLSIAPEIREIGGTPHRTPYILGYDAYMDGTEKGLAGIRVLGDNVLSVTLDQAALPFFYEMGLLECRPYPIHLIAPGTVVRDDGEGVYLTNAEETEAEPVFTAELLRSTLMDPETGYIQHPAVVSGPYTLTSWDGETAEFAINPYYKGNENGVRPVIPELVFGTADNADMMDRLASGEVDLLNKVTRQDNITRGTEMAGEGGFGFAAYPRIGLSYLSFACERPTVESQAVRQAIAMCLDRDGIVQEYTGGYGLRVDGYYGLGQWMYGLVNGTVTPPVAEPEEGDAAARAEYEKTMAEWEKVNLDGLTAYAPDPQAAAALLESDGWTMNAEGVREKEKDGVKTTLRLKLIYPEGNTIPEAFERLLIPNLEMAGIRLEMEAVPMGELLGRWYGQAERDADIVYLASNFDLMFNPAAQFTPDRNGDPAWFYTKSTDPELYRLAEDMIRTEPGDVLGYMQKWVRFQERFNETLPMLPVYSNIYFDFYTENLHDYQIGEAVTWSQAAVEAALYIQPEGEE